jgi:hypothetical protein
MKACYTPYNEVQARIELVAMELLLPDAEVPDATDEDGLIDFARRHGQSLDWLVMGDVRGMIRRMAKVGW